MERVQDLMGHGATKGMEEDTGGKVARGNRKRVRAPEHVGYVRVHNISHGTVHRKRGATKE